MEWNQAALQNYIDNGIEENQNLEYKSALSLAKTDSKKDEITKDVSAFANAAGGVIIYGIKEYDDQDKRHLPERITPTDRTQFSKEWLEQVINNIQPHITGIIIRPVEVTTGISGVAYVVEIPQSTTAHQANDFRYYRRYNFEVLRMHDYEIRDVMHRRTHPDLIVEFEHEPVSTGHKACYLLKVKINNVGTLAVKNYKLEYSFPLYDNEKTRTSGERRVGDELGKWDIGIEDTGGYDDRYDVTFRSKEILFPNDSIDITRMPEITYYLGTSAWTQLRREKRDNEEQPIRWTIYADDMPPKSGEFFLSEWHK